MKATKAKWRLGIGGWPRAALIVLPASFLMHFDKHVLIVLAPTIQREFGLDIVAITQILTVTSWLYALCQLPGAWIAKTFGPSFTIGLCLLAWSAVMLLTPLAAAPATFILLRGLLGAFQAPDWLSSVMILQREAPVERRSRASAALLGCGYLGAFLSGPVTTAIAASYGWRATFSIVGAIGALIGAAILSAVSRRRPPIRRAEGVGRQATPFLATMRRPATRSLAAVYFASMGMQSFVYVMLPLYLANARGTSLTATGWLSSVPFVTLYLGVLTGGFLSDHVFRLTRSNFLARIPAGFIATLGCGTCFAIGMSCDTIGGLMLWVSGGMALAGVSQVVLWSLVQDVGSGGGGFTTAWVQMLGACGLATIPVLCALLVRATGDWSAVVFVFPCTGLIAAIALCCVLPVAPQRHHGRCDPKEAR